MRTISRTDAKEHFDELLDAVSSGNEPVAVVRDGREVVVILKREEFERMRAEETRRFWETVDTIRDRNDDKDPDEVYADITALVEEVRLARRRT
jgi:prevent-host-death family protein